MKSNKKGEIATLLTLGLVIVGAVITLASSFFINRQKNLVSNPRAATSCKVDQTPVIKCGSGNQWDCTTINGCDPSKCTTANLEFNCCVLNYKACPDDSDKYRWYGCTGQPCQNQTISQSNGPGHLVGCQNGVGPGKAESCPAVTNTPTPTGNTPTPTPTTGGTPPTNTPTPTTPITDYTCFNISGQDCYSTCPTGYCKVSGTCPSTSTYCCGPCSPTPTPSSTPVPNSCPSNVGSCISPSSCSNGTVSPSANNFCSNNYNSGDVCCKNVASVTNTPTPTVTPKLGGKPSATPTLTPTVTPKLGGKPSEAPTPFCQNLTAAALGIPPIDFSLSLCDENGENCKGGPVNITQDELSVIIRDALKVAKTAQDLRHSLVSGILALQEVKLNGLLGTLGDYFIPRWITISINGQKHLIYNPIRYAVDFKLLISSIFHPVGMGSNLIFNTLNDLYDTYFDLMINKICQ